MNGSIEYKLILDEILTTKVCPDKLVIGGPKPSGWFKHILLISKQVKHLYQWISVKINNIFTKLVTHRIG